MRSLLSALCVVGLFAIADLGRAEDKKVDVSGTLTIADKTYKIESALVYETTRSDRKRTVVYLTEKGLDTAKLKASFEKKGNDEDFFPFDPFAKLVFDDKGELFQLALYAKGNNIILQGDPNIKVEASFKDGQAKGKAKAVKPDKEYDFDIKFEVKMMKP